MNFCGTPLNIVTPIKLKCQYVKEWGWCVTELGLIPPCVEPQALSQQLQAQLISHLKCCSVGHSTHTEFRALGLLVGYLCCVYHSAIHFGHVLHTPLRSLIDTSQYLGVHL